MLGLTDAKIHSFRELEIRHSHLDPVLSVGTAECGEPIAGTFHPDPQVGQTGHGVRAVFYPALQNRAAWGAIIVPPLRVN